MNAHFPHHRFLKGMSDADLPMATRFMILARQEARCFYCDEPLDGPRYVLDHVIPRNANGRHDESNRVAAHPKCDGLKGGRMPTAEELQKLARQRGVA